MSKKSTAKKIDALYKAIKDLGWEAIIMADIKSDTVPGMIIGEKDFLKGLNSTLKMLEDALNVPIENITPEIPESKLKVKKDDDDPTWH